MLVVLSTVVIVTITMMSAGVFLCTIYRFEPRNMFIVPVLGMAVVSLLSMIFSLIFNLNINISLLCLVPSLLGIVPLVRMTSRHEFWANKTRLAIIILQLLSLAAIFALASACTHHEEAAYDTNLYHMQIVKWLNEYGTPFGLGNLHSRLGHGSAWLTITALLINLTYKDSIIWSMTPSLLTIITAYLLHEIARSQFIWIRCYAFCFLPICFYASILWTGPSLYHDFPALALMSIIGCEALYFIFDNKRQTKEQAAILCICTTFSFIIKPLIAVTVVATPLLVLWVLHGKYKLCKRSIFYVFVFPSLAATAWCARNIIVSGFPFFPLAIFPINVDWRMTEIDLYRNIMSLRGWSRTPGPQFIQAYTEGISFWLVPWLKRVSQERLTAAIITAPFLFGIVIWTAIAWMRLLNKKITFLLLWPALSICYWFWLAPTPRFGTEYFWFFFAMGSACLAKSISERAPEVATANISTKKLSVFIIALLALFVTTSKSDNISKICLYDIKTLKKNRTEVRTMEHENGLHFALNIASDDDRCGDAPLPCAPYLTPYLKMRSQGNLGAGFRIEYPENLGR